MIFNVLHLLFALLVSTQVANPILSTGSTLLSAAGLGPFYNWITLSGVSAAKTDCCLPEERGVEACACFAQDEAVPPAVVALQSNSSTASSDAFIKPEILNTNQYTLLVFGLIIGVSILVVLCQKCECKLENLTGRTSLKSFKKPCQQKFAEQSQESRSIRVDYEKTQPIIDPEHLPNIEEVVEFCSQLPKDSHACNEVTATCVAAVASLQSATKKFEATKASETEQSKARLAALKADIDSTRPLVNELGQMWSERLGFQEEIIRLKKALAKANEESRGGRPEGPLSPLAEYEEKRWKEAEALNVTLLDEKDDMNKKIQRLEETESRLRKRLARQDAKAKEVELSHRTNDQDSQLLTERLEWTEAKLLEAEKELSKMQRETAEREADREAKSHAAQQVLEEWEQSIARHEDERELLRLRAVIRDCDLSSVSSASADLHADCEEKLRLSEEKNVALRRELEEQTAAQDIQRQEAQTILAEWERSINNIGDELLRSSLRKSHSHHARKYSTSTVASSTQYSTILAKSKFSVDNSFTLDGSASDTRPAELIYHRDEQLRALNARSALHEKEDLCSPATGPAAGSAASQSLSTVDYDAYRRSRDVSFSRLVNGGMGHNLDVGRAGTSEIGTKMGANSFASTDENHSQLQAQSMTTTKGHWRTVTRSSFASNRLKKTTSHYDGDSDPSVIIQSQNLPSHVSDLFVEGNSSRKIEDLVKKRLRPKRKTVGSMPVLSDPEQSTSSDETFIGRPSVSGNTPDLTISRMQNPIGLPDNTSTPTSHSRRSRILSGPEWLRTRTPPRRERR